MTYILRYARCVILERSIEVPDGEGSREEAWLVANQLENDGELGLEDWTAKPGSRVDDIQDYEEIWELRKDYQPVWEGSND